MKSIPVIASLIALSLNAFAQQPAGRRGVSPEERQKIENAVDAIPAKPPPSPGRQESCL